jgi:glyoxylase-like metal-dependent hydrolase (beta-lactamase superfamily II)/8-oxo-dGTP pyrophosphatase MutT (NUDIX family)
MSDLPEGIEPARTVPPRPSAAGIVLRRTGGGEIEVLLGLRARESAFLPGYLAFPGGSLEGRDRPEREGSFARCASREIEEETGLRIEPASWLDCGERTSPPLFRTRFRTRFLLAEVSPETRLPEPSASPSENERLGFDDPGAVLRDWERGEVLVAPPVLPMLRVLASDGAGRLERLAAALRETNAAEQQVPRIEFVPGIWMLPVATVTLPPATHTNSWMPGGARFAIVDPGSASAEDLELLLAVVSRRRKLGSEPEAILLTHHHGDHAAGAATLARELGIPVRAHPDSLERLALEPDLRAEPIRDGDVLDFAGLSVRAVETAGHSRGHLAFFVPERRALIAGDLASGVSTILVDPSEGDMDSYLGSLRKATALGCRIVLPGHGPPLAAEALTGLLEHRLERERKILAAIEQGSRPLAEIAEAAYDDLPELPLFLRARQALAHLVRLERRGSAKRLDPEGRSWRKTPA